MSEADGIIAAVAGLGLLRSQPTPGQTTGGQHAAGSEHYQRRAVDFGTALQGGVSGCDRIFGRLVPFATGEGAPVDELFWQGQAYKNGGRIAAVPGHDDHVHVGVRLGVDLAAVVAGLGVTGTVATTTQAATAYSSSTSVLTQPGTWARVVEVAVGLVCLAGGAYLLSTGQVKAGAKAVGGAVPGALAGKALSLAPKAAAAAL